MCCSLQSCLWFVLLNCGCRVHSKKICQTLHLAVVRWVSMRNDGSRLDEYENKLSSEPDGNAKLVAEEDGTS